MAKMRAIDAAVHVLERRRREAARVRDAHEGFDLLEAVHRLSP